MDCLRKLLRSGPKPKMTKGEIALQCSRKAIWCLDRAIDMLHKTHEDNINVSRLEDNCLGDVLTGHRAHFEMAYLASKKRGQHSENTPESVSRDSASLPTFIRPHPSVELVDIDHTAGSQYVVQGSIWSPVQLKQCTPADTTTSPLCKEMVTDQDRLLSDQIHRSPVEAGSDIDDRVRCPHSTSNLVINIPKASDSSASSSEFITGHHRSCSNESNRTLVGSPIEVSRAPSPLQLKLTEFPLPSEHSAKHYKDLVKNLNETERENERLLQESSIAREEAKLLQVQVDKLKHYSGLGLNQYAALLEERNGLRSQKDGLLEQLKGLQNDNKVLQQQHTALLKYDNQQQKKLTRLQNYSMLGLRQHAILQQNHNILLQQQIDLQYDHNLLKQQHDTLRDNDYDNQHAIFSLQRDSDALEQQLNTLQGQHTLLQEHDSKNQQKIEDLEVYVRDLLALGPRLFKRMIKLNMAIRSKDVNLEDEEYEYLCDRGYEYFDIDAMDVEKSFEEDAKKNEHENDDEANLGDEDNESGAMEEQEQKKAEKDEECGGNDAGTNDEANGGEIENGDRSYSHASQLTDDSIDDENHNVEEVHPSNSGGTNVDCGLLDDANDDCGGSSGMKSMPRSKEYQSTPFANRTSVSKEILKSAEAPADHVQAPETPEAWNARRKLEVAEAEERVLGPLGLCFGRDGFTLKTKKKTEGHLKVKAGNADHVTPARAGGTSGIPRADWHEAINELRSMAQSFKGPAVQAVDSLSQKTPTKVSAIGSPEYAYQDPPLFEDHEACAEDTEDFEDAVEGGGADRFGNVEEEDEDGSAVDEAGGEMEEGVEANGVGDEGGENGQAEQVAGYAGVGESVTVSGANPDVSQNIQHQGLGGETYSAASIKSPSPPTLQTFNFGGSVNQPPFFSQAISSLQSTTKGSKAESERGFSFSDAFLCSGTAGAKTAAEPAKMGRTSPKISRQERRAAGRKQFKALLKESRI